MEDGRWKFNGTPWEFIHMVRHACVVYEYVRGRKRGIMNVLMEEEEFQKAADELGITYGAVKAEMHSILDLSDRVDMILEETGTKT